MDDATYSDFITDLDRKIARQNKVDALCRIVDAAASWQYRGSSVFGAVVIEGKDGDLVQWNIKSGEVSTI